MAYTALMSMKKKKNVIVIAICMISCFIMYQLYFFLTLSSETRNINRIIPVIDHDRRKELHVRSEADQFINENGVIRGVYYKQMPAYRPAGGEFKCLHSDKKIPYEQVNDDYCDCDDSTDEPSTRACPNGTFYCETQHRLKPINMISTSKVNDGICDCCDGSDEWLHKPSDKIKVLSQSHSNHRHFVTECENVC